MNMQRHELALLEPDAVLAREHAAGRDARVEDLVARRRARAPTRRARARRTRCSGCRLPSPAWNTFIIVRSCSAAISYTLAQHLDEPGAGHDRVVQVVVGRDAGDRAERRLAALPQQRPLGLVGRDPHGARAVLARRPRATAATCASTPSGEPVDLDEQHRLGVARVAGADEVLDRPRDLARPSSRARPGTIPAAMIPLTVAAAASIDVKSSSSVRTHGRVRA